ncbi:MAG TPA: hypothetical protein PLX35_15010 [Cyclobacteriaceae bacterium]|nr:hypothetical protein [Cyclobacteriaceae bacterium]
MAKATTAKATSKPAEKETKAKKAPAAKKTPNPNELIVAACEVSLAKLNQLGIEHELQAEINWCLGSFQNDGNPIGLYQMAERSLIVFKTEQAKKTKGVTATLIKDLEKALQSR